MTDARSEILGRITAIERAPVEPVNRAYRRTSALDHDSLVALFCARTADYRAEVRRIPAAETAEAIQAVCAARSAARIVVSTGLPRSWRPQVLEISEDADGPARALDLVDGVITGCTVAIAETGTIVLTGSEREGRRALTLVPDLHICVVEEEQIVELVPEAISRIAPLVQAERRPITMISGPSATSDIELNRVEGVHGPRDLVVLVIAGSRTEQSQPVSGSR
jgi:L-lactate dehydrogenase complex protein LldG